MELHEYIAHDGCGLAGLIRSGEVSAGEVLACARQMLDRVNADINAVVEVYETPLAAAGAGAPFHGVPFLLKDLVVHAAGERVEWGSRLAAGMRLPHDSFLMQRFREAGLAMLGRTTAPEFGYCPTTESVYHGPTRNPWDLQRSPGGSSGGSAAAVAAGIVPLAHANDGGGSIRIPASCCGLVGLKPTRGRVSPAPDAAQPLSGMGIELAVTRTVRDTALLLDAVHGPATGDPFLIPPPAQPYTEEPQMAPGRLNIAFTAKPWSGVPVDPEVDAALAATAVDCEALGHTVQEARPEFDHDAYLDAIHILWIANTAYYVSLTAAAMGRPIDSEHLEQTTLRCWEEGSRVGAGELLGAVDTINVVSRQVGAFFEDFDLLLTPTTARLPLPLGEMNANDPALSARDWTEQVFAYCPFTALFNATGQPAISLPLRPSSGGLPIGIQFVAPWGDEATLLRVARQFELAHPWPQLAPMAGERAR